MPTVLVLLSVTVAGYCDLRWHRIPNPLVGGTIALAAAWHASVSGLPGLLSSLAGLLLGTLLLFPFFLLRGMGAGDVKYFGALGAAVTYRHVPAILTIALLVGALAALYLIFRRGAVGRTMSNLADMLTRYAHGRVGPHPVAVIDNREALVVHFTGAVAVATWIFALSR